MTSYFDILNVEVRATDQEISRAYRMMAKKLHPDLFPRERRMAELRFRLVTEAYNALKTADRRQAYIALLRKKRIPLKKQRIHLPAGNDNTNIFTKMSGIFRLKTVSNSQR
ncbi:MAG: J domain-containing protein [Micavibrio sp.]|nr:J domain-containing protein [Micavibrio sp.]